MHLSFRLNSTSPNHYNIPQTIKLPKTSTEHTLISLFLRKISISIASKDCYRGYLYI